MPDAHGNFKPFGPTRKTAEAWERIFGPKPAPIPKPKDEK